MKKSDILNNELFTDYKAVAAAADLIESGVIGLDKIEVIPVGARKRAYGKEIERSVNYYSEKRHQDRIRIEVNREGFYDMLPEGLFHRPPRGSSGLDEEGMANDVRKRREEEKQARLFFSPFDAEVNHLRVLNELYENRLDKRTTYTDLNRVFEFGWDEFNLLNKEQSIIWMHLLPEIQQKRNDLPFISHVLTALFNLPVILKDTTEEVKPVFIDKADQMELGKSELGINTIIGDSFLPESDQITIEIGPALAAGLVDFMPGHTNRIILDMAVDYLIPVGTDVEIKMLMDKSFHESVLSTDSENFYLGYTAYL